MSTPSDSPLVRNWPENRRNQPRSSWPRRLWLAFAVAAVAGSGVAIWIAVRPHHWHPPSGPPQFVSCTYGGHVSARCATVVVPEDPLKPTGRTIALHIAVLPATTRPAAGALFYLEGGPGGAATQSAVRVNQFFAEVSRHRDIVMIDQRGTGGSARLACPNERVRADDAAAVTAYLGRCFARLHGDPQLDTTSVAADDIELVRRALGYGKIDLYGASYGATLAQAYLRAYPGSVRSVVLDGGSLPDVRLYDVSPRNAERALDSQFARCAGQPDCHRDYPQPRRQLAELLARTPRRVEIEVGTFTLRPDDVAWTVDALSQTAESAGLIPYELNAAVHGDYVPLARSYWQEVGPDLDPRSRLAAAWVILCSEPWANFDPAATARAAPGSYLTPAAVARARLFRRACNVVPRGTVPANAAVNEVAQAPALLLAGGADPLDPVANLRGWQRAFPNGRLVVARGAGHGTIEYDCVQVLVARFVTAGSARGLDASCARHISLPAFETG